VTRPRDTYVDPVAVERAVTGDRVRLTCYEREEAVRQLREQGMNSQEIARRLHMSARHVLRIRQRIAEQQQVAS